MADELQIRCQRCGDQMDLKDPGPGQPWPPNQFWTCARCGRHFWTTYTSAPGAAPAKPQPAAAPTAAAVPTTTPPVPATPPAAPPTPPVNG